MSKAPQPPPSIPVSEIVHSAELAIANMVQDGLHSLRSANAIWAVADSLVMDYGGRVRTPAQIYDLLQKQKTVLVSQ